MPPPPPSSSSPTSSSITIRRGDIVKEGWLNKQSKYLKNWRRRYFVLTPYYLCSYKSPPPPGSHLPCGGSSVSHATSQSSCIYFSNPTEVLKLKDCSTVKSADEDVYKRHAFRVDTPGRVFFLLAESNAEKESWIGQIGRQMVRPTVVILEEEEEPTGGGRRRS